MSINKERITTKDGQIYTVDEHKVVHQLYYDQYNYDAEYVKTYDTPEYKQASEVLNNLRYAFICGAIGRKPHSVLDYGYGNGDFLKVVAKHGTHATGYDVTGVDVEGVETFKGKLPSNIGREVVCFWDALEHIEFMHTVINADVCPFFVAITVPCLPCGPNNDNFIEEFSEWKHRKPNEHLHHFNTISLRNFFKASGYKLISMGSVEDYIRKDERYLRNTISAVFVREDAFL